MICKSSLFLCRNEAIRTPDPYVPNVVRYQLRYIPMSSLTPQSYVIFLNHALFLNEKLACIKNLCIFAPAFE